MLKIQFKDKRQEPVWVVEKAYSIGSAPDNHLVITDPSVSPHHARLISEDGTFFLQDSGSARGTFVNGQRVNQRQIGCRDIIRCGTVEIEVIDPFTDDSTGDTRYWALIADASWLAGQEFPLTPASGNSLLIGRGSHCDIVFPGTHLSREHVRISLASDHITIADLNSANGSYINDARITAESTAVAGDRIRLDIYSFTLLGPGMTLPQSTTPRAGAKPAQAKGESTPITPKQWKTRPTSPGNRDEGHIHPSSPAIIGLSLLLIAALLATVIYLLL